MKTDLARTAIHRTPHAFVDKRGDSLLITTLDESKQQQLIDMYLAYQPRYSFSGLPPIEDVACAAWVRKLVATGVNLVAFSTNDGLVGHAALLPMDEKRCELYVAVLPPRQNVGIGSELVRCCIQVARELDFDRIWVLVEVSNYVARHVYEKCGFKYLTHASSGQLDMGLDVRRRTSATDESSVPQTSAPTAGNACRETQS